MLVSETAMGPDRGGPGGNFLLYYENVLRLDGGLRYTGAWICQPSPDVHLRVCVSLYANFNSKEL